MKATKITPLGQGPWCRGDLTLDMVLQVERIVSRLYPHGCRSGHLASLLGEEADLLWDPLPRNGSDRRLDAALQMLRKSGRIRCKGSIWHLVDQRIAGGAKCVR